MNHWQTWIHKIHHSSDLREATTFPFRVYSMASHGTSIQMAFCPETPKWEWESWNSQSWDSCNFGAHIFFYKPLIEMFEVNFQPFSKASQLYVARHLHTRNLGRFPTFNDWKSKSIWDSNSQNGNSLRSVRVHSLMLFCTPRSMQFDSQASFLARTLASPCLGRNPKVKVVT
jgi:hypothetical protein